MSEKIPYYKQWYQDCVVDDEEEIRRFADAAVISIQDRLRVEIDPKLAIAIYCGCLESYVDYLKQKQDEYPEFGIKIMDTLEIGYTTTDDEDDEKSGNFVISMYHCPNFPTVTTNTMLEKSTEIVTQWAHTNLLGDDAVIYKELNSNAKRWLKDHYKLSLEQPELTLMIFLIVHEAIIKGMEIRRSELGVSLLSITIAGLITIQCSEDEDGGDSILFKMEPAIKVAGKNDRVATGVYES